MGAFIIIGVLVGLGIVIMNVRQYWDTRGAAPHNLTSPSVSTAHLPWCLTINYLFLELVLAEPRVRHVLLHVVVVLVVLIVALRPRPERYHQRRVAQVPHNPVDPRVVAERCVPAVVTFVSLWLN